MPQRTPLDVLTFLQNYRLQPCLWNRSHPNFKSRAAREAAEAVLLPLSGLSDIKELRKKIRNIRCTYNQELGKIRRSINSGASILYEPKLAWFQFADSFLRVNHIERYEEYSPYANSDTSHVSESNGEFPFLRQEFSVAETDYPTSEDHEPVPTRPPPLKRVKTEPLCNIEEYQPPEAEPESTGDLSQSSASGPNEFVVFGQHVASQLRRLPLEEAVRLEEEIQSAITRSRLRCLHHEQDSLQ